MNDSAHVWNYFRAGGVVQVELLTTADLMNLGQLDQKLWMALEMPTRGLNCDPRTLDLLDTDKDGKIRPPELIEAVQWLAKTLKDPAVILSEGSSLRLDQFKDPTIHSGAQRAISQLGKGSEDSIHFDDFTSAMEKLASETFNGDGVVVAENSMEPSVRGLIEDIVTHFGSATDRSGKPGVNNDILQQFSTELEARATWYRELDLDPLLAPYGKDRTAQAYHAMAAVRAKIEDYFTRCKWISYDPRTVDAANGQLADFVAIADHQLSPESAELAAFPLARADAGFALPLDDQLNPAWQKSMQAFVEAAMGTTLGLRPKLLSESEWLQIKRKLEPFAAWLTREPSGRVAFWSNDKIQEIKHQRLREAIEDLLRREAALGPEFSSLDDVQRALLYRRDLGRILRNFVNFSDFYRHKDGIFQSGTLYIDSRATELCIEVLNPVKHTTMAGLSGAYLAY